MSSDRLMSIVSDLEKTLLAFVQRHQITHDEYHRATDLIVESIQSGQGAILFDLVLEAETLDVDSAHRQGSPLGMIGPFYLPGAPRLNAPYVMPQRPDEKGEKLVFRGTVRSTTGEGLPEAEIDMWQAGADSTYSGFVPDVPEWNLRGRFGTAADGSFEVATIRPAGYDVPMDGPIGTLLSALGRPFHRPAHLHLKVTAPGHEVLTSQLYFEGDEYLAKDAVNAVRDGLITSVERTEDAMIATYHFVLEPLPAGQ